MKLSIGILSLAILLSSSAVNAGVVHHHHNRRDHEIVKRAVVTVTHRIIITVDQDGIPYPGQPTLAPSVPENEYHAEVHAKPEPTKTKEKPKKKPKKPKKHTPPKKSPKIDSPPSYGGGNPEAPFPDNEIDCSTFPSEYGAIALDWLKTGGWTGIQINGGAGGECKEGALCSYACPPGYSKGQWPEVQPASGESHGGLLCQNGKLKKTRPQNKGLCVKGHGGVYVKNTLSEHVAICRTDYPGSENMVVPLSCTPGSTQELTVPIADEYYVWQGKKTSAQYYVNPAGISLEDGCVWGDPNGDCGNWTPMVFGAGYDGGITWLSISQNQLNSRPLNYNVEIVAGPGSKLNGKCKYENGQFYGGGYGEQGCTAALTEGEAYFRLYK